MALRTIQVGLGGWGRDWAKQVIPDIESVELVGYVDPDASSLELLTGDLPRFTSFAKALNELDAEAVVVTAGVAAHVPVVREALRADKHVLVEKPFAPTVAEATELVALAAERGRTLMVSQNYRYFPAPRAVQQLVAQQELGALYQIDVEFRRLSIARPGHPSPHHAYAQPLLDDMSIHHFDLLRFVVGEPASSIVCRTWNPPASGFAGPPAAAALITVGNVNVSYRGSWVSREARTPWAGEWRMAFEKGDVAWTSRDDQDRAAVDSVTVTVDGVGSELALPAMRWIDRWGTLNEFADAVLSKRVPECSGADNIGSLALRSAAIESAATGDVVALTD